jgi:hypothetical protein
LDIQKKKNRNAGKRHSDKLAIRPSQSHPQLMASTIADAARVLK